MANVKIAAASKGASGGAAPTVEKKKTPQKAVDTSSISQREDTEADDFDYETAIQQAEETDNPDGYKYQVAVDLAKQRAGEGVDDSQMRDLVDAEFAKLNPTTSGASMRGEDDVMSRFMGGARQMIDDLTSAGGDAVEFISDDLLGGFFGGVADVAGALTGNEGWGDAARETWDGVVDDGGLIDPDMVSSILIDLGLSAIPGVGVPLMAGKSLIQQSDNIREALEGRDSISRESLNEGERAAKGGSAALDTVLSVIPGLGRLRNAAAVDDVIRSVGNADDTVAILKGASEYGKEIGNSLAREASPSAMARVGRNAVSEAGGRIANASEALDAGKGVRGAMRSLARPTTEGARRRAAETFLANGGRTSSRTAVEKALGGAGGKAAKGAGKNATGRFAEGARKLTNRISGAPASLAATAGGSGASGLLGTMAANNMDLFDPEDLESGISVLMDNMSDDGVDWAIPMTLVPTLARAATRGRAVPYGPSGSNWRRTASGSVKPRNETIPLRTTSMRNFGNEMSDRARDDARDYYGADVLSQFLGGDEDGE